MTDTEQPTLEQLEAQLKTSQKAYTASVKAFETARDNRVDLPELIKLGEAYQVDAKVVTKLQDRIQNFALEAKAAERAEAKTTVEATPVVNTEYLLTLGVEKVVLTIDCNTGAQEAKFSGPGVKGTRAPRTGSNGGFKSRGAILLEDGRTFPSKNAAYMQLRGEADGKEPSPANSESATRWLTSNGYSFTEVAATA